MGLYTGKEMIITMRHIPPSQISDARVAAEDTARARRFFCYGDQTEDSTVLNTTWHVCSKIVKSSPKYDNKVI